MDLLKSVLGIGQNAVGWVANKAKNYMKWRQDEEIRKAQEATQRQRAVGNFLNREVVQPTVQLFTKPVPPSYEDAYQDKTGNLAQQRMNDPRTPVVDIYRGIKSNPLFKTPVTATEELLKGSFKWATDKPSPTAVQDYVGNVVKPGLKAAASIAGTANLAKKPIDLAIGATIGAAGKVLDNVSQKKNALDNLGEGLESGIETAWILPFTNKITNQIVGKIAPKLLPQSLENVWKLAQNPVMSQSARNSLIKTGLVRTIQRALAETPAEIVGFGSWDALKNNKNFIDAIADNALPTLMGNVGFQGTGALMKAGALKTAALRKAIGEGITKTIRRFATDPEFKKGFIDLTPFEDWDTAVDIIRGKEPANLEDYMRAADTIDQEAQRQLLPAEYKKLKNQPDKMIDLIQKRIIPEEQGMIEKSMKEDRLLKGAKQGQTPTYYRATTDGKSLGTGMKWAWLNKADAEKWAKRNNAKVVEFTVPDEGIDPIDLQRIQKGNTDRFVFDTGKARVLKTNTSDLDPLIQEAKKYKSPQKFIDSQFNKWLTEESGNWNKANPLPDGKEYYGTNAYMTNPKTRAIANAKYKELQDSLTPIWKSQKEAIGQKLSSTIKIKSEARLNEKEAMKNAANYIWGNDPSISWERGTIWKGNINNAEGRTGMDVDQMIKALEGSNTPEAKQLLHELKMNARGFTNYKSSVENQLRQPSDLYTQATKGAGKKINVNAYGFAAGLEPETDENGKPTGKWKINPAKAGAGMLFAGLASTKKNKAIIDEVLQNAESQDQAIKKVSELLEKKLSSFTNAAKTLGKEALDDLRGWRAALNKTMYETAGVDPKNGRIEAKVYGDLKQQPEIAELINTMEGYVAKIDDVLEKNNAGVGFRKPMSEADQAIADLSSKSMRQRQTLAGTQSQPSKSLQPTNNSQPIQPQLKKQQMTQPRQLRIEGSPVSGASNAKDLTVPNSDDPYFNTNKLNITPEAKTRLNDTIQEIKPQIEKLVGKKLSNSEAVEFAQKTSGVLNRAVSREETLEWQAKLLKARQLLADQAEQPVLTKDFIDNFIAIKSQGTDIARKLNAFKNIADPAEVNAKGAILEAVMKVTDDANKILEASKGVDFNNYEEAASFYRKFVKPRWGDWVDKVRYSSMLSSPNTHIYNFSSNYQGTGIIAPIEKTITGGLDWLKSAVTGKERQYSAGEGIEYAKGYYSKLNEAAHKFVKVLTAKDFSSTQELHNIPLTEKSSWKRKAEDVLSVPTRALQAMDEFFQTMTRGGVTRSLEYRAKQGIKVGNVASQAEQEAKKRLFNSEFGLDQEGHILKALEYLPQRIAEARNNKNPVISTLAKYTFPFVRVPSNLLKGSFEYSPMGVATLWGAKNKTEQLAKAIMGTTVGLGTAMLVSSDRMTWAEPTNQKQKNAFRAAGMQPYSIKLGNKWVSYAKLHPAISINLAMVAAIRDAERNSRLTDDEIDTALTGVAKLVNFFADQSYVKNIGDFVASAKGDVEGMARYISNYPQQLIPYRALLGWITRIVDPYQRQVDADGNILQKQIQQIASQIPGLSATVPMREDEFGNPIENQNRLLNAFSPARITTEKPQERSEFDRMIEKSRETKEKNDLKKLFEKQKEGSDREATMVSAGTVERKAKAYGFDEYIKENPHSDGIKKIKWEKDKLAMARKIYDGKDDFENITDKEKEEIYKKMGLKKEAVEYDYMANMDTETKSQYVLEEADKMDHDQLVTALISGRTESASGKVFATDEVLKDLYDAGYLSKGEYDELKKVKIDKKGNVKRSASSGGSSNTKLKNALEDISSQYGKMARADVPKLPEIGLKTGDLTRKTQPKSIQQLFQNQKIGDVEPFSAPQIKKAAPMPMSQLLRNVPASGSNISKARQEVESLRGMTQGKGKPLKLSKSFFRVSR